MVSYLLGKDTINGQEGMAWEIVDGKTRQLFEVKSLEAQIEKEKDEVKTLGKRLVQHKTKTYKGSGSMTCYFVTSTYAKMAEEYSKNGKEVYFDMRVIVHDPSTSLGRQSVILRNCNLDSLPFVKLDVEETSLTIDVDFTFDDVIVLEEFNTPILGGA